MSKNHIDEKIIPMKLEMDNSISMSLEDGYYISGKLETFTKAIYFNDSVSIYTPSSFIDMPDEIKEIKYPTSFRPEIIKTNLAGDINFSVNVKLNRKIKYRSLDIITTTALTLNHQNWLTPSTDSKPKLVDPQTQ